jgi:asparagine synthetase B (glutamine-hydrolysing)
VLLDAYIEWGEECLARLNGIYAFAVWDASRERLFLARDRIGVKPLFCCRKGGTFLFASELKALLAHPLVSPRLSPEGLAEVFVMGPARTPGHGVFEDIFELRPGYCMTVSRDGQQTGSTGSYRATAMSDVRRDGGRGAAPGVRRGQAPAGVRRSAVRAAVRRAGLQHHRGHRLGGVRPGGERPA